MADNLVEYVLDVKTKEATANLKGTAKAAQITGNTLTSSMQKAGTAVDRTTIKTRNSRQEWMAFRKEGANIDRLGGEMAGALSLISPELGGMASAAGMAAGGVEAFGRAMTVTNKKMLVIIVTIGVLVGAYKMLSGRTEEAEKKAEAHRKKLDGLLTAATKASDGIHKLIEANNKLKQSDEAQEDTIDRIIEKRRLLDGINTKEENHA